MTLRLGVKSDQFRALFDSFSVVPTKILRARVVRVFWSRDNNDIIARNSGISYTERGTSYSDFLAIQRDASVLEDVAWLFAQRSTRNSRCAE